MTTTALPSQAAKPHDDDPVRVILVEDDEDLRQGIADYLRLQAIEVTDVPSGVAFYAAAMGSAFDVAVLDVNLPDTSGFDIARVVSSSKRMGVIMLTARTGRDDRVKGYEQGADLYLTKPVDGEELALAIANLARRIRSASVATSAANAPATSDTSLAADPTGSGRDPLAGPALATVRHAWQLDLRRRRLTSPQGVEILLSGREAMLVEHLARAAGATVPRQAMDALLGKSSSDPESRRLDAALRRLRMKARAAGTDLPLHAVHAVGVRFIGALEVV